MAEKDCQEHAVSISEQETVQGLTSTGPPAYSEVMTYGWTIQNDPQRSLAPPYEPPSVPMTNLSPGPVIHSSASGASTGSTVVTSPPQQNTTTTQSRIDSDRVQSIPNVNSNSRTLLLCSMGCMTIILLIFFFLGTPTHPSLHSARTPLFLQGTIS